MTPEDMVTTVYTVLCDQGALPAGHQTHKLALAVVTAATQPLAQITDYQQLHQLPPGTLLRDSNGEVWQTSRPRSDGETWLCHFSDEYAFIIRPGGHSALGNQPPLPIRTIQEEPDMTHPTPGSLTGIWILETEGAPYPDHLCTFHPDGTWLIHNPTNVEQEPNQGGINDSVGMGYWWPDFNITNAAGQRLLSSHRDHTEYIATFWQLNAHADTHQPAPLLRVGLRLAINRHTPDHLVGRALAQFGDGTPQPAQVTGTRQHPDLALIPTF